MRRALSLCALLLFAAATALATPTWLFAFDNPTTDDRGAKDFGELVVVESISAVPEPATLLLLGTGLLGVASIVRKRQARR